MNLESSDGRKKKGYWFVVVPATIVLIVLLVLIGNMHAPTTSAVGSATIQAPDKKIPEGNVAPTPEFLAKWLRYKQKETELEQAKTSGKPAETVPYTIQLREYELNGIGQELGRMGSPQPGAQWDADTRSWKLPPKPAVPVVATPVAPAKK